jgi:hypothetical protein
MRCDLLVAALRMLERVQNDPCTYHLSLRRFVSADELVKLFNFYCCQFYRISGSGTSHVYHLPDPLYLVSGQLSNSEHTYDSLY